MEFEPEPFDGAVLEALLEGFRARAGAKERFQALSEYEVARRVGVATEYSYVEYGESPERDRVRSALGRLQRRGLVQVASFSGRYETFLPTAKDPPAGETAPPGGEHISPATENVSVGTGEALPTTFEGRLDELVRLLRSIDARLARLEQRLDNGR